MLDDEEAHVKAVAAMSRLSQPQQGECSAKTRKRMYSVDINA
jgi:hypothetical protein